MVRGSRVLYDKMFQAEQPEVSAKCKGRNQWLIKERNLCLVNRYVYYAKQHDLKYEQIVQKLVTEFFLSDRRIIDILRDNVKALKKARDEMKEVKQFKTLFPFFDWTSKVQIFPIIKTAKQ